MSLQTTEPSEPRQAAGVPDPVANATQALEKPPDSPTSGGTVFAQEIERKADAGNGNAILAGQVVERHTNSHVAVGVNHAEVVKGSGRGKSSAGGTENTSEIPPSFLPHSDNAAGVATVHMPASSGGQASISAHTSPGQIPSQDHVAPTGQMAPAIQEKPWLPGAQPEEPLSSRNLAREKIDRPLHNPSEVVVVLVLVLIPIVGAWAVLKFFSPTSVSTTKPMVAKSLEPTKTPSGAKKPAKSPTEKEGPSKFPEPKVSSIPLLNPYGTRVEPSTINEQDSSSQIRYLTDRKPSASWQSWWYGDTSHNGDKKGISLAIKLSGKSKVSSIKVESKLSGGRVEWRNSSESSPNNGNVATEGGFKPGLILSASEPVATNTVVLRLPKLLRESTEKHRLDISKITVE